MATTLPGLTETIDNEFVHTWYEIRPEAIDNILDANIVWAALKGLGCMVTQVGGRFIERTISYGVETTKEVEKGDLFPSGETELQTAALWTWRYVVAHAQRSVFDDQQNSGKFRIKSLIKTKLEAARNALLAKNESNLLRTYVSAETGKGVQGLFDLIPLYTNTDTGTYGNIARSNAWWKPNYKAWTLPIAVNMVSDMSNLYNTCTAGQSPPKLILTSQALFEIYENFALDISQIIKDSGTRLADLGFEVLRFKGKPMVWTSDGNMSGNMMMLNTDFIELVYDPNLWFDMTEWKVIPLQGERIAHIINACNLIGTQPRRHGLMETR